MKLKLSNIKEIYKVVDKAPNFDVRKVAEDTKKDPKWVAFGTGNIFRAYIARLAQDLIEIGEFDRGINVIETRDSYTVDKIYTPNDNLMLSVSLESSQNMNVELIGSIGEAVVMRNNKNRMLEIFTNKNLQIVSFTITEKGYDIYDSFGNIKESILKDFENNPEDSQHLMVSIIGYLYARFKKNFPVTLLSIDNLSKNGDVLKNSIVKIAEIYVEKGICDKKFLEYLNDEKMVTFPWSMIDKITPGPDEKVRDYLNSIGFEDVGPFYREKTTSIAKFVNSEVSEYLAIEDKFANGRPDFSKVGVFLVDRDTVDRIENMKVTACLNPLHTSLAVFGCLLGYNRIYKEMRDKDLLNLVKGLAYDEMLPIVESPGVIDPNQFAKEVIEKRFPNPFLPDSPQRIATDTSLKISIRFGKSLRKMFEENKNLEELTFIPLSIAGWLRYLLAVDDNGNTFELSPDPNLNEIKNYLEGISIGRFENKEKLVDLLKNEKIFGVDLEKVNLSDKIIEMFREMTLEKGSVRKTLQKYTKRGEE